VISNVGVTEQRKEKFDFSTYRLGLHGFYVKHRQRHQEHQGAEGHRGPEAHDRRGHQPGAHPARMEPAERGRGLKPDRDPVLRRRCDALAGGDHEARRCQLQPQRAAGLRGRQERAASAGRHGERGLAAEVRRGHATRKGSGLATALTSAANNLIRNGTYGKALARWSLAEEALPKSETNPPGLPKFCAVSIRHLAFLTPGNYAEADPLRRPGGGAALFEFGEKLGFDGAWVRQRHLERGVSSAATFLAAATQRTRRIELGAAVIQMGYENPFRLAEDLATVDVLSRGRLQVGLSAGVPPHGALLGSRFYDAAPNTVDFTHKRVARLKANLEPTPAGRRAHLHRVGRRARAAARAALCARAGRPALVRRRLAALGRMGGAQRLQPAAGQRAVGRAHGRLPAGAAGLIERYRASEADRPPRGSGGAGPRDRAAGWRRCRHAQALPRLRGGPRRAHAGAAGRAAHAVRDDLVGTSDEILERLRKDPVLPQVSELRVELPYNFAARSTSRSWTTSRGASRRSWAGGRNEPRGESERSAGGCVRGESASNGALAPFDGRPSAGPCGPAFF
jgi:alkanesulfonate monooxygenase SsuD/methylene tetrahydromethanopterin reductase-like flavin-dependent oxidoreductase (luciferase family)